MPAGQPRYTKGVTRRGGVVRRGVVPQPTRDATRFVKRATLPLRSGFLPLIGTTVSAVPWMSRNDARPFGGHGASARQPAPTGMTAANVVGSLQPIRAVNPAPFETPVIETRSGSKQPVASWRWMSPVTAVTSDVPNWSLSCQKVLPGDVG